MTKRRQMTTLMMKLARQRLAMEHLDSISPASSQPYDATTQTVRGTYPVPLSPTNHLPTKIPSASCQTWSDLRISETLLYPDHTENHLSSMISRIASRRLCAAASRRAGNSRSGESAGRNARAVQRRWMTPAPKPGDGPMMSRRADRELPGEFSELKIDQLSWFFFCQFKLTIHGKRCTDVGQVSQGWRRTMPIFLAVVAVCSVTIFNYQKSSSPIISSTLYALRTSPEANRLLGDEIYFKHQIPWISGEMNQVKGRIDISFSVRGSRGAGVMRFASHRPSSKALFETTEWSLTLEDGTRVDLLDGNDPFRGLLGGEDEDDLPLVDDESTKGFRQQGAYNR